MPQISITSLPFAEEQDIGSALEQISKQFSEISGLALAAISVYWRFIDPGHLSHAGVVYEWCDPQQHPLNVELFAADVIADERVQQLLQQLAGVIHAVTSIPVSQVFISYRSVQSGYVFDRGKIVQWSKG